MELYERQQFDFLLRTAVERFVERIEQRNQGPTNALARLLAGPDGSGVWLARFVSTLFQDFLLDNLEGACFVLRALAARPAPRDLPEGTIENTLILAAKLAFAEVLKNHAVNLLQQHTAFESVSAAAPEN